MRRILVFILALTLTHANKVKEAKEDLERKAKAHLESIENQISHLDWYFKVGYYNEGDKMMMDDVDEFVSNPINAFTMIKRLTVYWPELKNHLFNQTIIDQYEEFINDVEQFNNLVQTEAQTN